MGKNNFYVTTPIYYVTAKPHLGHLYSTVLADVAARWHALQGEETFFVTGTDEHGQKIAQAAEKAGKPPKEFVDSFVPAYQDLWAKYEIHYNRFIRTTDHYHVKAVQGWLEQLMRKGDIYKAFYEGWYCTHCETFVTDVPADASESSPPACPSCGRPTHVIAEESYFFRLSAYQERLLKFYEEHPDFIIPKERAHEVINFVSSGLKDLSISRTTITWGIPFPNDHKHVTYVWADALNNYITAVGYGDPSQESTFKKWWPANLQILGKDILRFHAIYWPAFLMASELALPKHLLVHGWFKVNQQKMSKSFGNVIDPEQLLQAYGADPVRYFLLRQAVTHDSEFSIQDLEQRIATDLANDLGNLLNRTLLLADKNSLYEVKAPSAWSPAAVSLRDASYTALAEYARGMNECMFHMALAALWKFIGQVNAYFHSQEPWKVAKADRKKFDEIISATCHSLRMIAVLLSPVMPRKMEDLLNAVGSKLVPNKNYVDYFSTDLWRDTFMLKTIDPLFKKPEAEAAEATTPAVQEKVVFGKKEEFPTISIDDVVKLQLLVGTIESCEEIPKSDKLYKLQVDFGPDGKRQILSGIRKQFAPNELIGKQAIFVFNLQARPMMGHESQGMLLIALNETGKYQIATVSGAVPNGTRVK